MKTISSLLSVTLLLAINFLSSCNSCTSNPKNKLEDKVSFDEIAIDEVAEEVYYSLPSPEEMIDYITANEVQFNHELLLDTKFSQSGQTHIDKTLLIGAYMANAGYLSVYSKTDYLQDYLVAIKYLADDVGLSGGLTKKHEDIIQEMVNDPASIGKYSNIIYESIINYVQNYDDGTTLALIFTGAYIESLHIIVQLHPEFYNHKQSIERIIEQKIIFDDITAMITSVDNKRVDHVKALLTDLNSTFSKFELKNSITDVKKNEDGSIQIIGNSEVALSDENYTEFKTKIFNCRKELIADESLN